MNKKIFAEAQINLEYIILQIMYNEKTNNIYQLCILIQYIHQVAFI